MGCQEPPGAQPGQMMCPAPGWEEPSSGAGWDPWSGKQLCSPGGQQGTQASARGPMASVADQGLVLAGQWREGLLHCYMALIRQHPELSPIWGHPIQKKCWENKDKTSPQGWCSPGTRPREVVGSPSLEITWSNFVVSPACSRWLD